MFNDVTKLHNDRGITIEFTLNGIERNHFKFHFVEQNAGDGVEENFYQKECHKS